jgi:hypothetical protein
MHPLLKEITSNDDKELSYVEKLEAENIVLKIKLNQVAQQQVRASMIQLASAQESFVKSLDLGEVKQFDWNTLSIVDKK